MASVPEYLDKDPDILNDTVLEICEKLAFKAHGGTYVEGLFDASASTIVSLIRTEVDWQPLELEMRMGDVELSYDPEVSEVPRYCKASGLNPFFGYTSEPPMAPAFKEEEPAGIATPALKAYGNLYSLLEQAEDFDRIPELTKTFTAMWGIDPADFTSVDHFKPELQHRSDIDLLKSLRNKSHRLYGYENEQNYVTVRGGGYTNSSLNVRRYVDWHRINLILRYIGVMLVTSDVAGRNYVGKQNVTLQYGLTAREFPMVTNSPHFPKRAPPFVSAPNRMMSDALSYAISYYTSDRIINAIAARNAIFTDKVVIPSDLLVEDTSVGILREALRKKRKVFNLDLRARDVVPYDIEPSTGPRINTSLASRLDKVNILHQISVHRSIELVLIGKMVASWNTATSVIFRSLIDRLKYRTALEEKERRQVTLDISEIFGNNGGLLVWNVLKRFRESKQQAEIDFLEFCLNLMDSETISHFRDKQELFWIATRQHSAFDELSKIFSGAFQKVVHNFNAPSLPFLPRTIKLNQGNELAEILQHLWKQKTTYWIGHYRQRRIEWAGWLAAHRDKESPLRTKKTRELIRYQWLTRWLPKYKATVENDLSVWPMIPDKSAIELLVHSASAFLKKRKKELPSLPEQKFARNLARQIDQTVKPQVSFLSMMDNVHETAKEMSRDIAKVFKNLSEPNEEEEPDEFLKSQWNRDLLDSIKFETHWREIEEAFSQRVDWAELDEEDELPNLSTREDLIAANPQILSREADLIDYADDYASMSDEPPLNLDRQDGMIEIGDATGDLEFIDEDALFAGMDDYDDDDSITVDPSLFSGNAVNLTDRSPYYEIIEKKGRAPDLRTWADRAEVTIELLKKCPKEIFQSVMDAGISLLGEVSTDKVQEEYDVQ